MTKLGIVIAGVAALAASSAASASVIGQQFTVEYRYPNLSTDYGQASYAPQTFTAHAGPDTVVSIEGVTNITVDLFDTGATISFATTLSSPTWNASDFNGLVLTSNAALGLTDPVLANNSFAGFDGSRVTLAGDEIQLNFAGLSYGTGTAFTVSFSEVPEPGSIALVGLGLAAVTFLGMRGRRAEPRSA